MRDLIEKKAHINDICEINFLEETAIIKSDLQKLMKDI